MVCSISTGLNAMESKDCCYITTPVTVSILALHVIWFAPLAQASMPWNQKTAVI